MQKNNRREFLKKTASVAGGARPWLAAGGTAWGGAAAQAAPHMKFPTAPRARLGVATWPFRAFFDTPTNYWRDKKQPSMDLTEFPALMVKRFNVHAIEPLSNHFTSTDADYLHRFRAATEAAGVRVIDLAVGGKASVYSPAPAVRDKAVAFGKQWVQIAVAVGSPSIRLHIAGVHGVQPNVHLAAQSLGRIAAYGAQHSVVINLENDDLKTEDAFFIVKVIEAAGSGNLHALPDFANSMMSGSADFNYRAVTAMFKHAYNIAHVKDGEVDGHGQFVSIDMKRTFAIAKAAGYKGYFSMEFEGRGDPYAGTQKLIEESLKYLSA